MKVRRRIVLVEASVKSPLSHDEITFIQSITANNLGEVLSINEQGFTLQFGARKTRESDIERSLLVSIAIRDHIDNVRFGLSYGLVSVTEKKCGILKIEGPLTRKVNALNKIAAFGQISVDNSIIKIYSRIADIRHVKYKNKDVWSVFGLKERPSRIRGLREAYTKLIGRDKEFGFLQNLVYQMAADQGQIVGVVGEAGIGKTRFTYELKTLLKLRGLKFYEGTFPYFGGSAYKGFKDIVSEIVSIQLDDPLIHFERKLRRIGKMNGLEDADVNFLINLYTTEPVSDTLRHLNEEQIRLGTFVAVKKLLFNIAEHPLIIILEDMQNADELSAKLVDFLAEGLPNKKLLLFLNYRPEYHGECEKKIYFNEIKLERFDEEKAKEFLKTLLDISFIPKQIVKTILKKSAGNPLYIEELVRSLLDKGKIEVINNEIKLKEKIETCDIQPTIHGVISYRMEKLPKDIRKSLQWGSCIGDEIDVKLLKTILERNISKDIEELEIRDFIVEKSIYPEEIYKFRHDLIREVAYESLSPASKKAIHLKIANYLEKKFKTSIDENLEVLAHHYTESSDHEKGFSYAYKAAQVLKDNYANEKAIDLFQKAFDLVDKTRIKDERKIKMQILEWMKDIDVSTPNFGRAKRTINEYGKLLSKDNSIEKAKYYRILGDFYRYKGENETGLKYLKLGLDLAQKNKDRKETIQILVVLTATHSLLVNKQETQYYADKALQLLTEKDQTEKANIYTMLGHICSFSGEYSKAINYLQKSIRIYKNADNLEKLGIAYVNIGIPLYMLGKFNKALNFWQKGLAIFQKTGNIARVGLSQLNIGVLYSKFGNLQKCFYQYNLAKKILEEIKFDPYLLTLYSNLGYFYEWVGEYALAKEYIVKSQNCLYQNPNKFWISDNLQIKGKIEKDLGNYADAKKLYYQALESFESINHHPRCPLIVSELIEIYSKEKNYDEIKNLLIKIEKLEGTPLTPEGKETLLLAKLNYELAMNKNTGLIDPGYLKNLDITFYDYKFELLSTASKYFKLIINDTVTSNNLAKEAIKTYNFLYENAPKDFRMSIKKKELFNNFIKEFS